MDQYDVSHPPQETPKLGVFLPTMTAPGEPIPDVAASARLAEDLELESVWVVDQLVAGTGAPFIESVVALSAAAAVTDRIALGFGVMIAPLRPPAWIAKQVGSLQTISGGRVLLGVGAGGDRHDRSWRAVGVRRTQRGRRTDEALAVVPQLVAGESVDLGARLGATDPDAAAGEVEIRLTPAATTPPLLVGGMSDAALRRAIDHGAEWFLLPVPPPEIAAATQRAVDVAAARGRQAPPITAGMLIALDGDPDLPDDAAIHARLTDPNGVFGMPAEAVDPMLVRGDVDDAARRISELREAGATRVVASIAAGSWTNQTGLFAAAGRRAPAAVP